MKAMPPRNSIALTTNNHMTFLIASRPSRNGSVRILARLMAAQQSPAQHNTVVGAYRIGTDSIEIVCQPSANV
jgi:hypothetical protein